jgi:hypothetical protein
MSDYCTWRRDIRGLEIIEDGVLTVHVEHAYRCCALRAGHDGAHWLGKWIDAATGDEVDPFAVPRPATAPHVEKP